MKRIPCKHCRGRGYIEWHGGDLRRTRQLHGLSLREVARRMGLSPAYLCDVELNRRRGTKTIRDFYDAL